MSNSTIIYDKDDNPIKVEGFLIKGQSGLRDFYGCPETPDDSDEVEIIDAIDINGNNVDLTDEQSEWAEEELWRILTE